MVDIERLRQYLKDGNVIDFGGNTIKAAHDITSFHAMKIVSMPWYSDWFTKNGVFKTGRKLRYLFTDVGCSRADMSLNRNRDKEYIMFDDMLKMFDCEDESDCDIPDISLSDLYDFMK